MNKPMSLIREEVKKELADTINNSNLPPFIIEPILQDFLREVHVAVVKQYENDKTMYERSLIEADNASETLTMETEDV